MVEHVVTHPVNAAGKNADASLVVLIVAPQRLRIVATAAGATDVVGNAEFGMGCTYAGDGR